MKPVTISAEEFDRRFDDGEDMADYMDWEKASRPGLSAQAVLKIPESLMARLDVEAKRHGLSRQSLIERWLNQRQDDAA